MNIAFSSLLSKYPDDISVLASKLGVERVEWDLNYIPIPANRKRLIDLSEKMLKKKLKVRFHFPYSTFDLLAQDREIRRFTLDFFSFLLGLLKTFSADLIVVHLGHIDGMAMSKYRLTEFQEFCKKASDGGIRVAVENLLHGITSNLYTLREICYKGGAGICLDVGHLRGELEDERYLLSQLQVIEEKIEQIHIYGREINFVHHPLKYADAIIKELVKKMREMEKVWWTIEVDSLKAFQASLKVLRDYSNFY
jgi:sugar phosphate isomerase/epimerase